MRTWAIRAPRVLACWTSLREDISIHAIKGVMYYLVNLICQLWRKAEQTTERLVSPRFGYIASIGVGSEAEDRKLPLLPPASIVQEILLNQQGVRHSLASLGSGEDKGEGPALRQGTSERDLIAGDPGLNPIDNPDAAGHAAPTGEDEILPFPLQRLRQAADIQDIPVAQRLSVDAQFPH